MVWSEKISKRNMLRNSEKVEWMPEWQMIAKQLKAIHGEDAKVMVFPCTRVQYPSETPLVL